MPRKPNPPGQPFYFASSTHAWCYEPPDQLAHGYIHTQHNTFHHPTNNHGEDKTLNSLGRTLCLLNSQKGLSTRSLPCYLFFYPTNDCHDRGRQSLVFGCNTWPLSVAVSRSHLIYKHTSLRPTLKKISAVSTHSELSKAHPVLPYNFTRPARSSPSSCSRSPLPTARPSSAPSLSLWPPPRLPPRLPLSPLSACSAARRLWPPPPLRPRSSPNSPPSRSGPLISFASAMAASK